MSTNIIEQRKKARHTVLTFVQLVDYVKTGRKKTKGNFTRHPALALFDETFELHKQEILLYKIGFDARQIGKLMKSAAVTDALKKFYKPFTYFERAKSKRGVYEVNDGITWDAIYCVRDILRELPVHWASGGGDMTPEQFLDVIVSDYAKGSDRKLNDARKRNARAYQRTYRALLEASAQVLKLDVRRLLNKLAKRSLVINRYDRMTGDAVIHVTDKLLEYAKHASFAEVHAIIMEFIEAQILRPEYFSNARKRAANEVRGAEYLRRMLDIVREYRDGI